MVMKSIENFLETLQKKVLSPKTLPSVATLTQFDATCLKQSRVDAIDNPDRFEQVFDQ
eukprot:UN26317